MQRQHASLCLGRCCPAVTLPEMAAVPDTCSSLHASLQGRTLPLWCLKWMGRCLPTMCPSALCLYPAFASAAGL